MEIWRVREGEKEKERENERERDGCVYRRQDFLIQQVYDFLVKFA